MSVVQSNACAAHRARVSIGRFTRATGMAAVACALVAACGKEHNECDTSITVACASATYSLQSINGNALPAFFIPGQEQWTAETITLKNDGTVSGTLSWREYSNGQVIDSGTDTFTGTYTLSGGSIALNLEDDPTIIVGTITTDGTVTVTADRGNVLVLKRV